MKLNETSSRTPYTIVGRNLEDCKKKLNERFSSNSYKILNFRNVLQGGFLGLFQRSMVEASYILIQPDTAEMAAATAVPKTSVAYPGRGNYSRTPLPDVNVSAVLPNFGVTSSQSPSKSAEDFMKNRDGFLQNMSPNVTSNIQLGAITKMLEKMSSDMNEKLAVISQNSGMGDEHPTVKKISDLLELNEFTKSYITRMVSRIKSQFSMEQLEDFDLVQTQVLDWIGSDIHVEQNFNGIPEGVVVIIGPTGVGKTTTIAKMAALIAIKAKNNVKMGLPPPKERMINTDIMRVGASEQLKNWGEAMGVDVDKAETEKDLLTLCETYRDTFDYLFVDTAGYSPNDLENIARMHKTLSLRGIKTTMYLAVRADTRARDLENIIRNFESFNFKSVIVTKFDETSTYGNVLSVLAEKNKEVSWITTGQSVMNTIEVATPQRFLMGLEGFKVDRNHLDEVFSKNEE